MRDRLLCFRIESEEQDQVRIVHSLLYTEIEQSCVIQQMLCHVQRSRRIPVSFLILQEDPGLFGIDLDLRFVICDRDRTHSAESRVRHDHFLHKRIPTVDLECEQQAYQFPSQ